MADEDRLFGETRADARAAWARGTDALANASAEAGDAVERLPWWAKLLLSAGVWASGNWVYQRVARLAPRVAAALGTAVPTVELTVGQLLLGLLLSIFVVVFMNNIALMDLQSQLRDMSDPGARADGGTVRSPEKTVMTVGGALVGAVLGWSFGPGGVLAGALLGASAFASLYRWARRAAEESVPERPTDSDQQQLPTRE